MDLSSAEREALDRLLPRDRQTGDLVADLIEAAQEAWRRRQQNTIDGGAVLGALHRDTRSLRTVSYLTKSPVSTIQRWKLKPGAADETGETTSEETGP